MAAAKALPRRVHGVQVLHYITSGHRDNYMLLALEYSTCSGRGHSTWRWKGAEREIYIEPAGLYERDTQLQSVGPAGVLIVAQL